MPRLFTALDLTPSFKNTLTHLQRGLEGVNWVEPENLHMTLVFIGDVIRPIANEIVEELAKIKFEPLQLDISEIGFFGSKKPRLLYLGIKPNRQLSELVMRQENMLRELGVQLQTRAFTPHITLARLKSGFTPQHIMDYTLSGGLLNYPPQQFANYSLFAAKEHTGGAPYQKLLDFRA